MKNWIYIGIFLDTLTKNLLKQRFSLPEGWMEYCDHMTVVYNDGSELSKIVKEANKSNMGKRHTLKIVAIGVSEKAIAVKVQLPFGVVCANKIAHITLGTSPEGKPVDSNDITIWNDIIPEYINGMMYSIK